ncbi:MAG: hypothetical protein KDB05_19395 [Planctomycetales bacterium]|nr:hypothetical protein [Planctomycetales bacterium]
MFALRSPFCVLLVLGCATSFALADEATLPNQFATQKTQPAVANKILEHARFLKQDSPDRPQIDAATLRTMNALPQYSLVVDNAVFHLSGPFAFYGGRQIALAFVEVDDEVHARVLYRSNSQFSWRMCDATDGGHLGKGFHEFDKQVPIPVTVALLKMYDEPQTVQSFDNDASRSQSDLAKVLLQGLTIDRRSQQCISQADGHYYSREYAALIPSQPMVFSLVGKRLTTASSGLVADPREVKLPAREHLPNLQKEVDSFRFTSVAYAEVNAGQGELTGRVFDSFDGKLRYLFFEDRKGRAALSTVEHLLPEVNALGLRSRYVDTQGMDAPLLEYFLQIPAAFGGKKEPGYTSNWRYVRQLPIIQYYYSGQGRMVPSIFPP